MSHQGRVGRVRDRLETSRKNHGTREAGFRSGRRSGRAGCSCTSHTIGYSRDVVRGDCIRESGAARVHISRPDDGHARRSRLGQRSDGGRSRRAEYAVPVEGRGHSPVRLRLHRRHDAASIPAAGRAVQVESDHSRATKGSSSIRDRVQQEGRGRHTRRRECVRALRRRHGAPRLLAHRSRRCAQWCPTWARDRVRGLHMAGTLPCREYALRFHQGLSRPIARQLRCRPCALALPAQGARLLARDVSPRARD